MRIAAALAPVASWQAILEAARSADEAGLDAIGLWDHYHSQAPELACAEREIDRVFVSIGGDDMPRRIAALADAAGRLAGSGPR